MTDLQMRIATAADIPTLIDLYAQMDDESPLAAETVTKVFQEIANYPNYYIYLASLNESPQTVIGTFSLIFLPTMMHPGYHKYAEIDSVTILPAYRCRGFGKQMMQFALNISREAGCYKMSLSSNVLRIHAHKFYEDLGFQKHGWSFSLIL